MKLTSSRLLTSCLPTRWHCTQPQDVIMPLRCSSLASPRVSDQATSVDLDSTPTVKMRATARRALGVLSRRRRMAASGAPLHRVVGVFGRHSLISRAFSELFSSWDSVWFAANFRHTSQASGSGLDLKSPIPSSGLLRPLPSICRTGANPPRRTPTRPVYSRISSHPNNS